MRSTGVAAAGTRLEIGGVFEASFQGYRRPPDGLVTAPPRSWGALPVRAASRGDFVIPVAEDEAVWLGLSPAGGAPAIVTVAVELEDGTIREALTGHPWSGSEAGRAGLVVPPARWLDGLRDPEGRWIALSRVAAGPGAPATRALRITAALAERAQRGTARVRLVDGSTFTAETGEAAPPPRDESSSYQGWRLP